MYQAIILPHFHRQIKHYSKKYRSLKDSIIELLENFQKTQHTHLGNSIYKVRLSVKEITRGKSKSFRLITLIVEIKKYIVPIAIYFKGDRQNLTQKEINDHLEIALLELQSKN